MMVAVSSRLSCSFVPGLLCLPYAVLIAQQQRAVPDLHCSWYTAAWLAAQIWLSQALLRMRLRWCSCCFKGVRM